MADPYLSGYTTRIKITIPFADVTGDETDFAFLVHLEGAADGGSENFDFSKSNADGFDIRFTTSDGETELSYERVYHDNTDERAEYHVTLTSVDADDPGTYFYLYYRITDTADGADPSGVWDSNFVSVYHMNDLTTSTVKDSKNAYNMTKGAANNPVEVESSASGGFCQDFTRDQGLQYEGTAGDHEMLSSFTIECMMRTADGSDTQYSQLVAKRASHYNYDLRQDNDECKFYIYDGSYIPGVFGDDIDDDVWHHVVGVRDTGTDKLYIYTDGAEDANETDTTTSTLTVDKPLRFGHVRSGLPQVLLDGYSYDGLMGEVRLSNIARSATWIALTRESLMDNILTYGSEEVAPAAFPHSQAILI